MEKYTHAPNTQTHTDLILCVLHLEVAPWKVASSCSRWKHFPTSKRLLLGAGPHPGTLRLHSCLTAFKCSIWYTSTIVSPLNTLFFSSGKKGHLMSVPLAEKKEALKMKTRLWERVVQFLFFFGWGVLGFLWLLSQTITNFGSDDILILSLWVCETTPSVCFSSN